MFSTIKKVNQFLIRKGLNLIVISKYYLYVLISAKNLSKVIFNSSLDNYYIPNWGIKNTIYIDPNKIKYINSVPMKFRKSTRFIIYSCR